MMVLGQDYHNPLKLPIYFWSKETTTQEEKLHRNNILEIRVAYYALKSLDTTYREFAKLVIVCNSFKYATAKKDVPREVEKFTIYNKEFFYDYVCFASRVMKKTQ